MFARSHIRAQILGRGSVVFAGHGFCTLALALAATAGLTACGQKGPLFFPPPPKALPTAGVTPVTPASTLGTPVETPNIPQPPPAAPPTSAPR
ncbi:MAG: lipoprotein [Polaromonas sp.]|uniref:LPS translocon maturation chaperone LptM n=1 Tax=Polaromonas sp. TaxID=1869339 RepID=UPI0027341BE9|nr:lipoprotein [Polaromonas sp.]MDP2818243.1 lipoprotein [Polaromonas sp.]